ncbi:glycosyltransferase family 2 protein [Aeoliella mucimassa]|uniref:Undecaprenyl-phosphate mannosyltransferase n=1 Tax=Aeoliella mucimassa TaxID=2527972 RepID=A0A518AWP1_9BACT|nr:glycosyltransferase family 2 protein [Aeoliella mucimassa]QDU59126.1 Undecaprenyl-phosphate mannosyltransferase [Aeoliella mucimassa]
MSDALRYLTALPVYNEAKHVDEVLDDVVLYAQDVLVVDDGSSDGTSDLLARRGDVAVARHPENRGYGAALKTAFDYAIEHGYDVLVTIDCDGQHEPQRIRHLAEACTGEVDIVSGSRYLDAEDIASGAAPADRRRINHTITSELNQCLGLALTDAFCGFKAYRVEALKKLDLTETGYAMPLEVWVQAAFHGLRVVELAVPLIYLDEERSFGGALDDARKRLAHYREVVHRAVVRLRRSGATPATPHFTFGPCGCAQYVADCEQC